MCGCSKKVSKENASFSGEGLAQTAAEEKNHVLYMYIYMHIYVLYECMYGPSDDPGFNL